jgi:phage shock protein C
MEQKLYRSRENRWLAGVCGGLGKYWNIDPVIIRLLAILAFCLCFFGTLVAYIIMAIVVPPDNKVEVINNK